VQRLKKLDSAAVWNAESPISSLLTCLLDGDDPDEIVVGLGRGGAGWLEVKDHTLTHLDWARLHWEAYDAADGTTWSAVGSPAP